MCFFCLLEPRHATGARGVCSCKSASGILTIRVPFIEESGPRYPVMFTITLRPVLRGGGLGSPAVNSHLHLSPASHLPLLEPQPHDADTHAPLVYMENICPYLARPAPGWASTSSPAPTGLSLSLRLFEVWLWGPVGVTSNALSG